MLWREGTQPALHTARSHACSCVRIAVHVTGLHPTGHQTPGKTKPTKLHVPGMGHPVASAHAAGCKGPSPLVRGKQSEQPS